MKESIRESNGKIRISELVAPDFRPAFFFNFKGRYRVLKGARNTGKSFTFLGYEPIIKLIENPMRNIIFVRQNNVSNRTSTFPNLLARIEDLGLSHLFTSRDSSLETSITYKPTGQKILFKGFDDPQKIASTTFAHGYPSATDVYIEEAFEIESKAQFRKLDGSIRGLLPDGLFFQITLAFNAWNQEHWLYDMFFKGRMEDDQNKLENDRFQLYKNLDERPAGGYGKGILLHTSSFRCNVFRDPDYDETMAEMKERTIDIYKVEALGMWGNSSGRTYDEFTNRNVMSLQDIANKYSFATFAIGVDTGLSDGQGGKRRVKKNQDVDERIKSATVATLVGVTSEFETIVVLEEYFHTEIEHNGEWNTDSAGKLGEPELLKRVMDSVLMWEAKYARSGLGLFSRGATIDIYVDGEDIGFVQGLNLEAKRRNVDHYVRAFQSGRKLSVQSRADFEKIMMAWGNFVVADNCRNVIREFKNARKDPDTGRARTDQDDHALTSLEYAMTPQLGNVMMWKDFKERG